MALLPVYVWPDPVLSTVAKPVETFDAALETFVANMFETMEHEAGIGLAANQVGVLQRVLVVDLDPSDDAAEDAAYAEQLEAWAFKERRAFINPEIIASSGKIVWEEGCLSVPGISEQVERAETVVVRAFNADGTPFELEAHGLYAVCLQHEIDHLNGRVFVEYLSKLKRDLIKRKMKKLIAQRDDGETA